MGIWDDWFGGSDDDTTSTRESVPTTDVGGGLVQTEVGSPVFYPTGYGPQEGTLKDAGSILLGTMTGGMAGALTAGAKYAGSGVGGLSMNEAAAREYQAIASNPSNQGMTTEEMHTMAVNAAIRNSPDIAAYRTEMGMDVNDGSVANVSGAFGPYAGGYGYGGAAGAVGAYSEAVKPREATYTNIFGSTTFDPVTGQITRDESQAFRDYQTGLMGQLTGAMEDYARFDTQAAAQRYIDAATAGQTEARALEDQTALSRLIAGGQLGSSARHRALAEQEKQRGIQDVQTQLAAQQFADEQKQQRLASVGGLFGLTSDVAKEQFMPYQATIETVPTMQEIYGASAEPAFQYELAQQQLDAQESANKTSMWTSLLAAYLSS